MDYPQIIKILIKILFLNWLVASAKIFIGIYSGAISIVTDGIHSFFDGASNIVGLIGIKISQKPKDKTHPYGHRKYEALASLGILFLLVITIYELVRKIIQRFLHPVSPEITFLVFGVLITCLTIDYFVARYEFNKGKELQSVILRADSFHTKSHIFTTGGVILGGVAIKFGFSMADPIVAVIIILFIVKMIVEVFQESSKVLCDASWIQPGKIEKIALGVKGVKSSHEIRTRGLEGHIFLDMHLTLDSKFSLDKAHQIAHQVRRKIHEEIPEIKDITIHVEPEGRNKGCICR